MSIPSDPVMLQSYLNTLLRDRYPSLEALCEDLELDKTALLARLAAAGYDYDSARNQII